MVRKSSVLLALSLAGCWDMRVSGKLELGNAIYSKSTQTEESHEPKAPELGFWEGLIGLFNSKGFTAIAPVVSSAPLGASESSETTLQYRSAVKP